VYLASGILVGAFLVVAAAVVTYAEPIVGLFVTGEEAPPVIALGSDFLRIVAPTYAIMAVFHMMNGAFHGAGSTKLSMGLGLTTLWGFRAGLAALLIVGFDMGATGAWYGIAASNVVSTLVGAVFFYRGRWLGDVLEDDQRESDERASGTTASHEEERSESPDAGEAADDPTAESEETDTTTVVDDGPTVEESAE